MIKVNSFYVLSIFESISFILFLYHIETRPLISRTNQWAGFYMIEASVMKELIRG